MQKRESLDDLVKRGDVSFAYEVFNRFLERVDARLPMIEKMVNGPQDYTKSESIVIDREAATWAKSEAEAEENWRKRIKYDLLVQKMEKTTPEEAKDNLLRRYKSFAKLLGSVQRLKAKLAVSEEALELDCNLFADDDVAAGNLAQFFDAIAENAPNTPLGRMLSSIQRNKVGTVLHLRARLPPELLVALWSARNTVDPVAPLRE